MPVSKTGIDRLGDRLKSGIRTEDDLRLLDDYRRTFGEAYEVVIRKIRQFGELPSGRPAKSTVSIVEKLGRESIRLSQMQDIAGCRIVVSNVMEQDRIVGSLRTAFPVTTLIDRRDNPSHGYKAVHIIAEISKKPVEIQIRSSLQQLWAELSEKSSDVLDPSIKYGGGPGLWRSFLRKCSELVADHEKWEKTFAEVKRAQGKFEKAKTELLDHQVSEHDLRVIQGKLEESRRNVVKLGKENLHILEEITDLFTSAISGLEKRKGQKK